MKALAKIAAVLCGLLAVGASAAAQSIATSYSWTSTGPIISAKSDSTHNMIAVKDPSAVYYNGQWIIYASDVNSSGNYNMEYLNVGSNWSNASSATPYFMDNTPGFGGYHTAPQVFYFAPQNKWYLIFQSGQPQYSTNSDPTKPQNWTQPQNFFASQPSSVSNWIDFWVICDSQNCYLFFAGDNGNFYRSSTPIGDFPNGFNTPVIVYSSSEFDLFEADNVYSVEGTGAYLADIECIGSNGERYFRALTATSLGGTWTALGNTNNFSTPFLGQDNVTFQSGVNAWTTSFSSGGLLIDGDDQTDSVNPKNLQFLYQGANPSAYSSDSYGLIPWQLGLATSNANSSGTTPEAPYGGTAAAIPGTVMTENYDTGGQGVAYNVTSTNGTDNAYRTDGVDLETATAPATSNDLGWTATGQWFKYTVNVATAGTYNVSFLVAGDTAVSDAFHLSNAAGTNLTGTVAVPSTGGWQDWTTVTASVTLPAGKQTLTLNEDNTGWNIDSMAFSSNVSCTTAPSDPTGLTATAQSSSAINLSWSAVTAPSNCTIAEYKVYRGTTSGFVPASGNQIASVSSGTAFSDTGLSASTTYYYVVEAVDAEGSSSASTQASAETQASNSSGSFTLAASANSVAVTQGASATDTVTVTDANGFSGSVSLGATGLPSGVTANFGTNPTTGSSVVTFTAGSTAAAGTSIVTITGTSGTLTASTSVTLTVNASTNTGAYCHVVYAITSQWSGGFGAGITLENTGTANWSNWTLTWTYANGQTVTSLWNGTESQSGANVTVSSLSYNGSIAAGGSYSGMGFNGSWNNSTNSVPTSFAVNGNTCQ